MDYGMLSQTLKMTQHGNLGVSSSETTARGSCGGWDCRGPK